MRTISNEQKAKEIANIYRERMLQMNQICDNDWLVMEIVNDVLEWKDEQYKQDRSGFCNFLKEWAQEWLIEQLTAFAAHLNKRGAFCEDLCMDFEHEAQSFIELQKPKKL